MSVGHLDLAHDTLREKLFTPTQRRTFLGNRVVPGSPGVLLDKLQEQMGALPCPADKGVLQLDSSDTDDSGEVDDSEGGGGFARVEQATTVDVRSTSKPTRPQTAPQPAVETSHVRRSVMLQNKVHAQWLREGLMHSLARANVILVDHPVCAVAVSTDGLSYHRCYRGVR